MQRWPLVVYISLTACSGSSTRETTRDYTTGSRDASVDADGAIEPEPEPEPEDAAVDDATVETPNDAALDAASEPAMDAEVTDSGEDAGLLDADVPAEDAAKADAGEEPDGGGEDAASEDAASPTHHLIDFEAIAGMSNSPGSQVPAASRLSSSYQAQYGAVFSGNAPFVGVVRLGTNHATSGTNGIGSSNADGALSYALPIQVAFFVPGQPELKATTNFVKLRGDLFPASGTATLTAYDLNNSPIGSVTVSDTSGLTLQLQQTGIHRIVVTQSSSNIAFDDLEFAPVVAAPAPAG